MARRDLPRAFGRVVDDAPVAVDAAKAGQREIGRRDERARLPLWIDRPEEKYVVAQDRPAHRRAGVSQSGLRRIDGAVDGLNAPPSVLEAIGVTVPKDT